MNEYIDEQEILAAFRSAGLDPAQAMDSDKFMDAFQEELTHTLMEASRSAADKREAALAAQLDLQFKAELGRLSGHERLMAIHDRRQKLNQAREDNAGLTSEQIKTATLAAIGRTTNVLNDQKRRNEQHELRQQYEAELKAVPFYSTRINTILEIKQKYRKMGLQGI